MPETFYYCENRISLRLFKLIHMCDKHSPQEMKVYCYPPRPEQAKQTSR